LAQHDKQKSEDREIQQNLMKSGNIPQHIAIIMDGNGRWAQERGMSRISGHRKGVESVRDIVEACGQLNIKYLTLYAFSTENWKRPQDEVSMLMRLLVKALKDETDALHENNVRLITIGDMTKLPREVQRELADAIEKTKKNTGLTLNLALSYSGRWDILRAVKKVSLEVRSGKVSPEDIDESYFSSHMSTGGIPDPDLLIRTSGELRISNFLLWQLAYTEMYISSCFWPAFRRNNLYEAVTAYQKRERRFGLVSEQLPKAKATRRKSIKNSVLDAISGL
jgi:undecaprenyl diphosphate synthase